MMDVTWLKIVQMLVATPGMIAPAETAAANNTYSIRSWARVSAPKRLGNFPARSAELPALAVVRVPPRSLLAAEVRRCFRH